MVISGAVHRYGDSIDTDIIIPAYLLSSRGPAFLAKRCMIPLDPEFPSCLKRDRSPQPDALEGNAPW
jgi:3-isopropylmalate/(R)-2-methylmalate dehydratase small subunit